MKAQQQTPSRPAAEAAERAQPKPGSKGARTRLRILDAAREVFEERGYLETRVVDIASRAGIAIGGYYSYFNSKDEIFLTLVSNFYEEIKPPPSKGSTPTNPIARIDEVNGYYIDFYRENAKMIGLIESVMTFDDDVRTLRMKRRRTIHELSGRNIAHMQELGLVFKDLDPYMTAEALTSMVVNFLYTWLVLGEPMTIGGEPATDDVVRRHLTSLWTRALGLDHSTAVPDEHAVKPGGR
ncbi:TetR/AcrR family transcriptional regulator [Rhodococcus sp. NM-2]|uniref:TetR/AcrR family transcriptional regulator n=1 Tax=Rhodococcus sp. NM-2 TaxID=3401174 RepID=UPI003AAA38CD